MSLEDDLCVLERRQLDAFEAWDRIRAMSAAVPLSHRHGLGFLAHVPVLRQLLLAAQRLRYTSALAEQQRILNLIALERTSRLTALLDQRVATVDDRVAGVGQQVADVDREITDLDRRLADAIGAMADADGRIAEVGRQATASHDLAAVVHRDVGRAMDELHDRMDTTTSYVTFRWSDVRSDLFELREHSLRRIDRAEERLDDQDNRIGNLEHTTRLHGSYIRRLEQSDTTLTRNQASAVQAHPLAGDSLPRLISVLEQRIPDLLRARQVGVSIQDGAADEMIATQAAYFGERLGMYGTRDSAWYHVDFTSQWNRDILFENALSKLESGGYFILVSHPDNTDAGAQRPLSKIFSDVVDVAPRVRASVHVWRRP